MKRRPQGFTLIELMVTIMIVGILAGIGLPGMRSLIASQRIKVTASNLQASLSLTRAEALKHNANVTLAPNTGTDWTSGWKITDPNGVTLSTTPPVKAVTMTGPAAIIYQGSGRVNDTGDRTIRIYSDATPDERDVEVDLSGIAMILRPN